MFAASFDESHPYTREQIPDFGLYLDDQWQPPWDYELFDWADFGVPADVSALAAALRRLLDHARDGQRVEIGCLGGHGRTGTALGCLAILAGEDPREAVTWVRRSYCAHAIETAEQEAFVTSFESNEEPWERS
jgi:protein-tyrosine phosphatase